MKNTGTVIAIVLIAVLALLLLSGVGMMGFGGFGMMGPGMMGNGYGGMMGGYGFNPFGAILSLAIWAVIIGGIVLLVIWLVRNVNVAPHESSESPLDILKARYAKGEITKEQFDQMRRDLA
jgi:putative membrane protein